MALRKQIFTLPVLDLQKAIDVDDSAGRSVPINMNFVNEGYLTKDLGFDLYGGTATSLRHSIYQYKKKSGANYVVSVMGNKLQRQDGGTWVDIARAASATFTVTIATPGVFSQTAHGLVAGNKVSFTTTGALPTGLTAGTEYFVIAAGLTADAFQVSTTLGGSAVNTSGSQSGTHTLHKPFYVTENAEFGYKVYDDVLWLSNGVDNYMKWDGTTITEYSSAPKGNILEIFEDRMFVAGVSAEPYTVYYSGIGTPQTFGGSDLIKPLGTDAVTFLNNYYGALMIFKFGTIWKLSFQYDSVADAFLPKIEIQSNNYGACSRKAVTAVENDLWFFTGREVRALGFQEGQIGVFGVNPAVISEPIKETLKLIDVNDYDQCAVSYNRRRFYLSVPLSSDTNNVTFVCHLLYGRNWTKYTGRTKATVHDYATIDGTLYSSSASAPYGVIRWFVEENDAESVDAELELDD